MTYNFNKPEQYCSYENISYWEKKIDNINCIEFCISQDGSINHSLYNESIYNFARKVIGKINPDIIHIIHSRRIASFIKAAIDLRKKYIITFTDSFMVCPNLFLFTKDYQICVGRHKENECIEKCGFSHELIKLNRKYSELYVNNAFAIVTPSYFEKNIYKEYFNVPIVTINHGNDCIGKNELENKIYPKKKLILGFTSNSSTLKGLSVAIQAMNQLNGKIDAELHVFGDCDDVNKLIAESNVKFFGRYNSKDIPNIMSNIDILICPSIGYESYSFVTIEAFSNCVPVIATNEGGMKELVKNCVNGFTFNVGDFNHLSQIIRYIYENQNIINTLRNNLSKYSCPSVEEEMVQYGRIYEKCVNDESIKVDEISVIKNIWENIIKSKYGIDDYKKYKEVIFNIAREVNYKLNDDNVFRFIVRLKNMQFRLAKCQHKRVILWGSGMSAKLTIKIIRQLYNDVNIKLIVDKFKDSGELEGIQIKNITELENEQFDYLIICTSPGKKEAEQFMDKLNKKVNIDYNFGICVE